MNHMAEVAKMLGVELGEEFECSNGYKYILKEDGIIESKYRDSFSTNTFSPALVALLNGELTIKRKPWKPSIDDTFWLVDQNGDLISSKWRKYTEQLDLYKLGNCYRTYEEAGVNRDKWVAFYASDEVLEVQNDCKTNC